MPKMYDFGADISNVSANERKALSWPVAIWTCYIPESDVQDINILEHLILRLVGKGITNVKSVLCSQIGFNKDLIDAAIESCRNAGFFDDRHKDLKLSADGKSMVAKYENPYLSDLEASKKNKKVFMVQDLLTKSVVPVFDITKLPEYFIDDDNAIVLKYEDYYGKKPKSAAIKTALRYWAKLCINGRLGIETGSNTIDCSESRVESSMLDGFIPFEDEVDWELIQEDGNIKEIKTLADKEEEDKHQKELDDISNLTIIDDSPEIYFARGFIAIDRNAPNEIKVVSPFGSRLDDWYRTVINRLRACDEEFEYEIQLFLMEKKEELKNVIAFGNEMDIDLFNEYPFICNDPEFKAVKKTIERLTASRNRFDQGEDDTINFAQSLRQVCEASLRLIVKHNKYLYDCQKLEFWDYKHRLSALVKSYSFLSEDIFQEYRGGKLFENVVRSNDEDGYAPAYMAMILMDAWNNKNGISMDLLRNMPRLPITIKEFSSNLNSYKGGWKHGAGTIASHGGDEVADLKFSLSKVDSQYREFENIFRALYNRYMEAV